METSATPRYSKPRVCVNWKLPYLVQFKALGLKVLVAEFIRNPQQLEDRTVQLWAKVAPMILEQPGTLEEVKRLISIQGGGKEYDTKNFFQRVDRANRYSEISFDVRNPVDRAYETLVEGTTIQEAAPATPVLAIATPVPTSIPKKTYIREEVELVTIAQDTWYAVHPLRTPQFASFDHKVKSRECKLLRKLAEEIGHPISRKEKVPRDVANRLFELRMAKYYQGNNA